MHCATCGDEMLLHTPPDDDDCVGSDDCLEWACAGCGVIVVAAPITVRVWLRPAGDRVAPQQRRAA